MALQTELDSSTCLIFIEGYTIAIFRVDEGNANRNFVFDSNSRDTRGLSVPDGTSVLMKFDNLHELIYASILSGIQRSRKNLLSNSIC